MNESLPGMEKSITHVHRRLNLLTGEWVFISPHRAQRPRLGRKKGQVLRSCLNMIRTVTSAREGQDSEG
jgi:hypothetical protein